MPKIDYMKWGRFGVVIGLFWGLALFGINLIYSLPVGYFDAPTKIMSSGIIGLMFVGWMALAGLAQYAVGRSVFGVINWQNKKPYWKLVQVGLVGAMLFDALALVLLGQLANVGFFAMTIGTGVIGALVNPKIAGYIYKILKWQLPA